MDAPVMFAGQIFQFRTYYPVTRCRLPRPAEKKHIGRWLNPATKKVRAVPVRSIRYSLWNIIQLGLFGHIGFEGWGQAYVGVFRGSQLML